MTLDEGNLVRAKLFGTNLDGAALCGANLHEAGLTLANVTRVNLSGADFTGATVEWTNFANVDLSVAKGLESVNTKGLPISALTPSISRTARYPKYSCAAVGSPRSSSPTSDRW